MPKLSGIIDVHSHAVLGIGQGSPFADPAQEPTWSAEGALAIMDEHGIEAVMLSVPDNANHNRGGEGRDIARRINDILADLVAKHPRRFGAMATVPAMDIDGTLEEMAYALDTLHLEGVSTSTNIDDVYLGEARFDPWFEEMDRRGLTLFIHPMNTRATRPLELGINAAGLEYMFDSTRMLTNMIVTGTKRRFPDIKMISTHVGGTLPFLANRIALVIGAFGNDRGLPVPPRAEIMQDFASFFYDLTGSTTPVQLNGILDLVPTPQILFGFDIPYMPKASIAPAIEALCSFPRFTAEDIAAMSRGNALRLYPGLAARLGG